jgi:lipopolysaccharide biosynthesis glycosyltransferase
MTLGPIVTACDERFAMPLATAFRSIVEANRSSWPLEFFVLFEKFSRSTKNKVVSSLPPGTAVIQWMPVDLRPYEEFGKANYPKAAYARCLLPEIFPETVRKVLYLDADILVLDDLRPLWATDLKGCILGAVEDGVNELLQEAKLISDSFTDVPRVQCYFNTGVLLIDIALWREARITSKAFEYLRAHPRAPFPDQDALNYACDGLWRKLDHRWNFHDKHWETNLAEIDPAQRPGIVHFATNQKPWLASSLSPNRKFYNDFRRRTRFAPSIKDKLPLEVCFRCKRALKRSRTLSSVWSKLKRPTNGIDWQTLIGPTISANDNAAGREANQEKTETLKSVAVQTKRSATEEALPPTALHRSLSRAMRR